MNLTWHTFRTRVAPVLFLAGMLFLTVRTCQTEFAEVRIAFDFGPHAAQVRDFRVDVFREGDDVSSVFFKRSADSQNPIGTPTIEAQLDAGTYRLLLEVTTTDRVHRFERVIETTNNAHITVNLARDLN